MRKKKVWGFKISMLDWNLQDFLISAWSFLCAWQMRPTSSWNYTQKVSVWLKKGDTVAVSCWKSWVEARLCKSDDIHCDSWQKNMCSSLKRVPREEKKEGGTHGVDKLAPYFTWGCLLRLAVSRPASGREAGLVSPACRFLSCSSFIHARTHRPCQSSSQHFMANDKFG